MLSSTRARADVYQVLDHVMRGGTTPPGTNGLLFSAIDVLRKTSAPAEDVKRVEQIAVAVHRLEWANRIANEPMKNAVVGELTSLAAEWINSRIQV